MSVKMIAFDKEEDLYELTGLDHDGLWDAGFDLDDWDFGVCTDEKLHREPEPEEIEDEDCEYYADSLIFDYDMPCWWLLSQMDNYCCGVRHTEYKGKHYYMVYHS